MFNFPSFNPVTEYPEKEVIGISEGRHQAFGYIAKDPDGRVYVTWRDGAAHGVVGAGRLRMRRYDQHGAFDLGVTVLAEPDSGRDLRDPMICFTPDGALVLVWNDTPAVGTGSTYFKTKTSTDRGETWGPESIIAEIPFNYARVYGGLKVMPSTDPSVPWEIGFTAYYQTSAAPAYLLNFFISRDGGASFDQASDIGQAPISVSAHNETAMTGLNDQIWFAAARASDAIHLKISTDGRKTWGAWATIPWTVDGVHVAPALDIVKDCFGRPWLLLMVSDRANDWIDWSVALVEDVLRHGVKAFTLPIGLYSTTNAYPANCIYDDGNMLLSFTREYPGQVYASTHLGYFNYGSFLDQRGPKRFRPSGDAAEIKNGAIHYTSAMMLVDTENGASSDSLTTITGGKQGDILILQTLAGARDVVVVHGGNIQLATGANLTLTNSIKRLVLQNHGPYWVELSRA